MTEEIPVPEPAAAAKEKSRRLWLTVGEVVAVAGLALGALNYWETHHERTEAERDRVQAQVEQKAEAAKAAPFIMRGTAEAGGGKVLIEPLKAEQVIQSQRYLLPRTVLDHAMEIQAGRPQIDLGWFDGGLKGWLKAARKAGAALPKGEAELPVGVVTTYIEGGEMRTDRSLYRVGYTASSGLLGSLKIRLTGLSLVRRGVPDDLQAAVDRTLAADPAYKARPMPAP